ncbi:MAG: hypothetical protein FJW40_21670 [Acidobacteria bacterium]|nr:hypothetical protein [Acidobacteriota bacterium]
MSENSQTTTAPQGEALQRVLAGCYQSAVQSIGEYAVELDPAATDQFRRRLYDLSARIRAAEDAAGYVESRTELRACLREYTTLSTRRLEDLRHELAAAVQAFEQVASTAQTASSRSAAGLENQLAELRSLSHVADFERVRRGLDESIACLTTCIDQMKRDNRLVVAQLLDEIRALQDRLDRERDNRPTAASQVQLLDPEQLAVRAAARLDSYDAVCLLLIDCQLDASLALSSDEAESIVSQVALDFRVNAGGACELGWWSESRLIALTSLEHEQAVRRARIVEMELSRAYKLSPNRTVPLKVKVTPVDALAGDTSGTLFGRAARIAP